MKLHENIVKYIISKTVVCTEGKYINIIINGDSVFFEPDNGGVVLLLDMNGNKKEIK